MYIPDLATRQVVIQLLNLIIETLEEENATMQLENQHLRDELAWLNGGSGTPDIKPPAPLPSANHSSKAARQTRTPRGKKIDLRHHLTDGGVTLNRQQQQQVGDAVQTIAATAANLGVRFFRYLRNRLISLTTTPHALNR